MKLYGKCDQRNPKISPPNAFLRYNWFDFGGVISATFLHATSCLSPVLEGGPEEFPHYWTSSLPIKESYVFFVALKSFLSNLNQGSSLI
jgi:hypothetical protein